ncbi:GyrI-like domain-containing protein [Paenibacillus silvisoli]|uniref:GyrI-like domain-containing protein n=1 Tax=Paenibacillus silvisoli TaxID=3110539 RepID=UPI002803E080|nr:GyrI-like domain-containing protein [Paenibacillus silvisoli]
MKIELVETSELTAFVGVRAVSLMSDLGSAAERGFNELLQRRDEIQTVKNPHVTYGITPPNYKGNDGLLDFYCCYEVDPLIKLPAGMVHIHLLPRLYTATHYKGPASKSYEAYDFTSGWLRENGNEYDDVSYYLERYDEKTLRDNDDERNEVVIYCPVRKKLE